MPSLPLHSEVMDTLHRRKSMGCRRPLAPRVLLALLSLHLARSSFAPAPGIPSGHSLRLLRLTQVSARELLEMARQAVPCPRMDAAMRKELAALQATLHARARQHGLHVEPLSPEEISGLMER